jgi:hypothetical protein
MDIHYHPFPYAVMDNFLSAELYKKIADHTKHVGVMMLPNDLSEEIYNDIHIELNEMWLTLYGKTPNPSDPSKDNNDCIMMTSVQPPHFIHKIHKDAPWKRLSVVLYIGDVNLGTKFHKSKTDPEYTSVVWKANRAVAFVPSDVSWHSFENSEPHNRTTLLINMGSEDNIKEQKNLFTPISK